MYSSLMSQLSAYANKHPVCCICHTVHTLVGLHSCREAHDEYFVALGFEMQPMEMCSLTV